MEFQTTFIKNSWQPCKNLSRNWLKITKTVVIFLVISMASFAVCLNASSSDPNDSHHQDWTLVSPPHPISKAICTNSRNSSSCFSRLSSIPISENANALQHILEISINETLESINESRSSLMDLLPDRDLSFHEKNAVCDCLDRLEQSVYQLEQVIVSLHTFPATSTANHYHRLYGDINSLLSAAMTNKRTCTDGFLDLEEIESDSRITDYVQEMLTPSSRMISNCLSKVKLMENTEPKMNPSRNHVRDGNSKGWIPSIDRKLMARTFSVMPNIVVARDGTGNYSSIGEAIRMAPNRSRSLFVIKIKRGIYNESVRITREKTNIMLIGDGMSSTVITGSKNVDDGFSTFSSATLTVIGDKFFARDISVENTAGPKKHQAVALTAASDSAFYRCNFSSYQDTLYAHSLRQLYRECTIQGTVDFIFGNAAAVFQKCIIVVRKPLHGQQNMIIAQGRDDPYQNTGTLIQNSVIMAAPEFTMRDRMITPTFLGRPWRNYSRTIVMKSYLGNLIHPRGWSPWNKYSKLNTVEYVEYKNFGPGANTSHRVRWRGYRKNCSEEMLNQYTAETFLLEADDWLHSVGLLFFSRGT